MAFGREEQQPLLVSRTTSHADRRLSEEDALLTSQRTAQTSSSPPARTWLSRWREIALFLWALLATAAVIVLAVLLQHAQQTSGDPFSPHHDRPPPPHPPSSSSPATPPAKRNLIFMVSDGMGPSSLSLTRTFHQHVSGLAWNDTLVLDRHLIGQSRTRSSDSWVTDSAAGATAFACGFKSYNGAISVLPPMRGHEGFEEGIGGEGGGEGRGRGRGGEAEIVPCGTVMEAAKLQGYLTGLVVTTRVTDATPATFVSHVRRREMEDAIARQMVGDETNPLGRVVDLVVGGGRCRFLPNWTAEGCRGDDRDLVAWARDEGWTYVSSREEWENLDATTGDALPLLALLAPGDIPFEIDRRQEEEGEGAHPSLEETTRKALQILEAATRDRDQGFFVMIEGSRIDHAGHFNDPAAQVHEVLAYDRAVAAVLEFIAQSETPTLLVATSDHETGGLAVARQVEPEYPDYLWYPEVLANVSHSAAWAAHQYHEFIRHYPGNLTQDLMENYLYVLAYEALGIEDVRQRDLDFLIGYPGVALDIFADMISRHAQIGWSTHGHTAADVNIYTSDPHAAAALRGNHENTDVGKFLRSYLDLDKAVEKVTKKLRKHAHIDDNTASISRDGRSPYAGGNNFALIPWRQDRDEFTWSI